MQRRFFFGMKRVIFFLHYSERFIRMEDNQAAKESKSSRGASPLAEVGCPVHADKVTLCIESARKLFLPKLADLHF